MAYVVRPTKEEVPRKRSRSVLRVRMCRWLSEENDRTDLPNYVLVCVGSGLMVAGCLVGMWPVVAALRSGTPWSGTFTAVGKSGQPKVWPIQEWTLGWGALGIASAVTFVVALKLGREGLAEQEERRGAASMNPVRRD
jgi:hypothetical protein